MDNNRLSFLDDGQSIALAVSQLHSYFQNAYSSYQVKHGQLVNKIRATETEDPDLYQELQQLAEQITLFSVLRDSLSIADNVLQSSIIIKALGLEAEVYQIHKEDEKERSAERDARKRLTDS